VVTQTLPAVAEPTGSTTSADLQLRIDPDFQLGERTASCFGRDASALSRGCSLVMRVRNGTRTRTDSWPRGRIWCALLGGGAAVVRRGGRPLALPWCA
jgi:hypothetical protein